MDSTELRDQFRLDVVDTELPYLWSDQEVFSYINDVHKMFARKTGGFGDFSSPATQLSVTTASDIAATSLTILKIRAATLADGTPLEVLNYEDLPSRSLRLDGRRGHPRYLVTGMERNKARIYPYPDASYTINLLVDRLPLTTINDEDQLLEVNDEHKFGLGLWVKHLAYAKQDAETLNKTKSADYEAEFLQYCAMAKSEKDRAKHKTRTVAYGGI